MLSENMNEYLVLPRMSSLIDYYHATSIQTGRTIPSLDIEANVKILEVIGLAVV